MNIKQSQNTTLLQQVDLVIESFQQQKPVTLQTSGTTGPPKRFLKDLQSPFAKKRGGNTNDVWLLTYSPKRWAGISVILHSLKFNCRLIVPETLSFKDILFALVKLEPTHVGLTPSMFRNLLLNDVEKLLTKVMLKQITFGGEAATQSVLDLAKSIWHQARITHVYASTEFGDICAVSDGQEGIPIHKFDCFKFSAEGELIINDIPSGDFWERRKDRYYFLSRKEEVINVGGNKVNPLEIEEIALQAGVKLAKVYGVKSPVMGNLVALDYVGEIDEVELKNILRQQLPKWAYPVKIKRCQQIALSAAGKMVRKEDK